MKHWLKLGLLYSLLLGCTQLNTLNYNKHLFNVQPTQIIWFQIAGLADEHLSLLKYSLPSVNSKIVFENMTCSARMWNYNLYELRPEASLGFTSQLVGKKNIRGICDDYNHDPIWNYLDRSGYRSAIIESGIAPKLSVDQTESCGEPAKKFLNRTTLWKMYEGKETADKFHFSESITPEIGKIYYDKSCRKENCYSSIFNNTQALYEKIKRNNSNLFLLIRDFSFGEALRNKQVTLAKDRLIELERSIAYFVDKASLDTEMMVIVTSSAPINMEFPNAGKNWSEFDKKGSNIIFHNTSLISPLYVFGARSENFCGLFEEAQVMERILTSPRKQGVELPFFN